MEEFIEQQLVQRTRLGKDNTFIDIGSGIGQVIYCYFTLFLLYFILHFLDMYSSNCNSIL